MVKMSLGSRLLPMALPLAKKRCWSTCNRRLIWLIVSVSMDKIFGKGKKSGFMIPQNKIDQLIKNENLLTTCQ